MTPASLEALARALARLEPKTFTVYASSVFDYMLFATVDSNVNRPMICSSKDGTIKDAALFGAVWRCALRHSMAISVVCPIGQPAYVRCEGWDDRQEPVFILDNQIGVALALAYCAARGDKVEF